MRSLLFFIDNITGSLEGIILSKERNKLYEIKFLLISLRYNVFSLLIVQDFYYYGKFRGVEI